MKKVNKSLAVLLALILSLSVLTPALAAEKSGYTITNPYANIDFSSVNTYKAALHTHTNASDGDPTLKQSIERHAESGFDIVATTDHGTVNYSWEYENPNKLIFGALSLVGKSEGKLEYLGKSGTFDNGMTYTLATEANGDDYLTLGNQKKILRVPYGIENNAVSVNAHVNGWFADYHNNGITIYEDAVKGVDKAGGLCVINHPGEYTKARYALHSDEAYNTKTFSYWYYVNKYAHLIDKYDACIGLDINSKGDGRTRFERVLWDVLLKRFADNGKNVYAIASSDAHRVSIIDSGFVYALMPELSSKAFRKSLENGEFFAASHYIGNPDELADIAKALKEFYGETDLYNEINDTANAMFKRVEEIENGTRDADDDVGIEWQCTDGKGYVNVETEPKITDIKVDDDTDTITISSDNALIVRWISNGKLIATTKADDASFRLSDYSDKLGNYVRAEVFGEGGVIYTQAFLLNAEQNAGSYNVVDKGYFNLGFLDFLFAEINNLKMILSRM